MATVLMTVTPLLDVVNLQPIYSAQSMDKQKHLEGSQAIHDIPTVWLVNMGMVIVLKIVMFTQILKSSFFKPPQPLYPPPALTHTIFP